MSTKNSIIIAGVVIALIVLLLALGGSKPGSKGQNQSKQNESQTDQSAMPKFVSGDVTRVEGSKVFFASEGNKVALASESTRVIKQIKAKDGSISLADIKLTEIKAGDKIVVYYSEDPVSGQYKATKVQVIQ